MGHLKSPAVIFLFVFAACRGTDGESGPPEPGPADALDLPVFETGVASRYADSLAGRPTASGETYDPDAKTCAHKKLPFGTHLHIKVLRTGAEATCRVNDRGPFAKARIVDMSRAVAEQAGVDGVAKVELRKLPAAEP